MGRDIGDNMRRRGQTFAEMMVILAILTLFALLATPRLLVALGRSRLDAALQAVRENLEFARSRTISSGIRHQVYVDVETRELLVQAYRPEEASEQPATGLTDDFVLRDRLPDEVKVAGWTVSPMVGSGDPKQPQQQETNVLMLYPEGRSDDAVIVLESSEGERRGLMLNGFTGELHEMTDAEIEQRY